ncbi:hypothetical protein CcaCcLH18_08558 [Colletotrichum camelliae]|nr:hypothetical protein CcaCcLH18_08558 [Colletotrichum camelliae]
MYFTKQIVTFVTALLLASVGVQAACGPAVPGNKEYYGGTCAAPLHYCGASPYGGYAITCCDTAACT